MDDQRKIETELRERWAGHILLDELHLAEMREIIRAHTVLTGTPRSVIAAEVEMSPRRLRGFLDGAELTDKDWEVVSRWCEGKPTPNVVAETVAVGVLARWADRKDVHDVRAAIAHATREAYTRTGLQLPPRTAEALSFDCT
ncbi:MAG TPA: hypothetical protein VFS20_11775 [Longimicrobium sp.]|nr:hypothetical protein [Longimicrobium sp.]